MPAEAGIQVPDRSVSLDFRVRRNDIEESNRLIRVNHIEQTF